MTDKIKKVLSLTPHCIIILSLLFLTLFITDRFNGAMNFIAHDLTESLIIVSAIICFVQTAAFAAGYFENRKNRFWVIFAVLTFALAAYLLTICSIDIILDGSRYMLREANKFALLAYIIASFASSITVATIRRAEIKKENTNEVRFE